MRYLAFVLSMPHNNSWNNKWSNADRYYAVTKKFLKKDDEVVNRILEGSHYRYNFGDGWVAGISIKEVSGKELRQIRKNSKGFCGYNWMIDSIIKNDEIILEKDKK